MILRQHTEQSWHWFAALGLSFLAHAGAFITMFDIWTDTMVPASLPLTVPEIAISTITMTQAGIDPASALENHSAQNTDTEPDQIIPPQPAPQTVQNAELTPDTLKPEEIQPVTPLQTTRLNPILSDLGATVQGISLSATVNQEHLTPVSQNPQSLTAATPGQLLPVGMPQVANLLVAPPPPDPSPEETKMAELIQKIRDRFGDPCLVALPQRQSGGDPLVIIVAAQDRVINAFVKEVLADGDTPIEHRPVLIDTRQCPALTLVRESIHYPAFRLSLNLRTPIIGSGGNLIGTIENVAGMYTSLLLIDDNGVVQDLRRFTSFSSGRAEFNVPVSRDGTPRDTSQILFAIATQTRPVTITNLAGHLAKDFFAQLQAEFGSSAIIALAPFEVR